jgi:hypothetical protein
MWRRRDVEEEGCGGAEVGVGVERVFFHLDI